MKAGEMLDHVNQFGQAVRLVSRSTEPRSVRFRLSAPFFSKVVVYGNCSVVTLHPHIIETLKCRSHRCRSECRSYSGR